MKHVLAAGAIAIGAMAAACGSRPLAPLGAPVQRLAVIGDYGCANLVDYACNALDEPAGRSAVAGIDPDHVVSVGDNNYDRLQLDVYDQTVGAFYGNWLVGLRPHMTRPGPGVINRFWPTPGNHDWYAPNDDRSDAVYLQYFADTLGSTAHQYDVDLGPVHLFSLDSGYGSDFRDPGGDPYGTLCEKAFDYELRSVDGPQAHWLRDKLAASHSCFNLVLFHHPPYGAGTYVQPQLRWPFKEWGADAVITGHEHSYQRLAGPDGMVYFISGSGGANLANSGVDTDGGAQFVFGAPDGSDAAAIDRHGALSVIADATEGTLSFQFHTTAGLDLDPFVIRRDCAVEHPAQPDAGAPSDLALTGPVDLAGCTPP